MLFWFTKPEKAMNKRLNERLGIQEQKERKTKEKIESLKTQFVDYTEQLQFKLQQCMEVLNGMVTPDHSHSGSLLGSPKGDHI